MAIKFARRLITVSGAALGAYILLFRPWQHRWGATDEAVKSTLPADELVLAGANWARKRGIL